MGYTFFMLLVIHILIAISSIILTTYTYLHPSKSKLNFSYILAALTIMTGSYLIFIKPAHMVQSCMAGVTYLGFVTLAIVAARKKLAKIVSE